MTFREALHEQRWDDHRYYHRSRINQFLHLVSAISFITAFVLIKSNPVAAVLFGWIVAMVLRQIGHFFFEPKDYDDANEATHQHKEEIKLGYNLKRKVILMSIWALTPVLLYLNPTMFGWFEPYSNISGYVYNLSVMWLVLAGGALIFRTVHLFFLYDVQTGLVWLAKIMTDPFHDIKIYYKSPYYILKGELIDPMDEVWVEKESK